MISINNLSISFGGFSLFDNVNFHISSGEKIGLTGRNGSGKTTLLKIINGIISPSQGEVQIPSNIKIGYLPQEMEFSKDTTVLEAVESVFNSIKEIELKIDNITNELSNRTDYDSIDYNNIVIKLNDLTDKHNILMADNPRSNIDRVLLGLGFSRSDFNRNRREFSQGWNMRIELAKILLNKPDIFLLDEPTNHLDIESISWLESHLVSFKGSLVLISHDRRFLDSITNRTVEIVLGKINDYKVPYSQYLILRKERIEQQRAAYDNQRKLIEKTEDFIDRFRYKATKSNQVQSRIKQLEKIDIIEIEQEDNSSLNLKFPPAPRSGNIVVKSKNLSFSYDGSNNVLDSIDLTIERGEKIALLGKNGQGKTTFVRLINSELTPTKGSIELGHNVLAGYFAQNQEDILDKNDTVFDTLDKIAFGEVRTKLRDILGSFLFSGEDIDKKVGVLSGGERARLAMAKLLLKPYNLLILDEPTNHMDIKSKEILKQALINYSGTIVLVSHDRDFLDGLVTKIYEFKDRKVKEHLGGLDTFLASKKIDSLDQLQSPIKREQTADSITPNSQNSSKLEYQQQKEREKEQKKVQNRINKCEDKIYELEILKEGIEERLSKESDIDKITKLVEEYDKIKKEIDSLMTEWENLSKS